MNKYKKKAIICDLDGTLALLSRDPLDASLCSTDKLNQAVGKILTIYPGKVFIVSGRNGKYRKETEDWLKKYKIVYEKLFMRDQEDFRHDFIVKKEVYETLIASNYEIEFVLEDRDQAVKMWRDIKLTCFQVAYGNF